MEIENLRTKSGISGLDRLIGGGYPKGSFVVVSGGPGTGKTIVGCQFLYEGASSGEKCLCINVEQSEKDIISQALQFGWDFETLKKSGKLDILTLTTDSLSEVAVVDRIRTILKDKKYQRIVIDSLTSFAYTPSSSLKTTIEAINYKMDAMTMNEIRRANISALIDFIKSTEITTIGLAHKIDGFGDTLDMISEFKGDGLIVLSLTSVGSSEDRTIHIKKMRKTKLNAVPYNFEFSETGIVIKEEKD